MWRVHVLGQRNGIYGLIKQDKGEDRNRPLLFMSKYRVKSLSTVFG